MKKKTTPVNKHVAAGKKRASTGIRDSKGRYISKILYNEVVRIALAVKGNDVSKIAPDNNKKVAAAMSEAGLSAKEVKKFYETKKEIFNDIIEKGEITGTPKNSNQLEKSLSEYKGSIEVNGQQLTNAKAKYKLMQFKQFLSTNINVVDFTLKPQLSFDGKMKINIPDQRKLVKDLLEYFGADKVEELDEFTGAEISEAIQEILGEDSPITIYAS